MISRLSMAETGMWQCVARNEAGELTAYSWLRVKSELNADLDLDAIKLTGLRLELTY